MSRTRSVIGIDGFGDVTSDDEGRQLDQPENTLARRRGRPGRGGSQNLADPAGFSGTVLSSDGPVRVLERYVRRGAVSNRRAEVILGRVASKEPFKPLGFDLANCDRLFEEKAELLAALRSRSPGRARRGRSCCRRVTSVTS
jgi:hypothetical protein